jgi:acyl-CoA reductase-like NAD-dependent aldehyde dehydrogenase
MRIAQEEVFGPVLSVIKFKDEEEAVQIANDIAYGLGAGVWTQSVKRAHTMAKRIKAGTVWVNTYRAVSFLMPFGATRPPASAARTALRRSTATCSPRACGSTTVPAAATPSS